MHQGRSNDHLTGGASRRISAGALLQETATQSVWVVLRKPRAPIKGKVSSEVAVEITRPAG